MMTILKKNMNKLIGTELMLARKQHGYGLRNVRQAGLVILEEASEMANETFNANNAISDIGALCREGIMPPVELLEQAYDSYMLAACEAVQTAAMLRKLIESTNIG